MPDLRSEYHHSSSGSAQAVYMQQRSSLSNEISVFVASIYDLALVASYCLCIAVMRHHRLCTCRHFEVCCSVALMRGTIMMPGSLTNCGVKTRMSLKSGLQLRTWLPNRGRGMSICLAHCPDITLQSAECSVESVLEDQSNAVVVWQSIDNQI